MVLAQPWPGRSKMASLADALQFVPVGGLAGLLHQKRSKKGGLVGLLQGGSEGYDPTAPQTPGAFGNNPMAMDTGGQPIPPAPHWVNSLMGLGQATVNGFMAPSNALAGKYDQIVVGPDGEVISMFDPRMIEDANAMAGLVTTGALPIPKPAGALGIFGGTMAKTADMAALAQAEKMAASGASRDEIWNATGWFKGVDDKWRFEIPDSGSAFDTTKIPPSPGRLEIADQYMRERGSRVGDPNAPAGLQAEALMWADLQTSLDAPSVPMSAVMDHPELYAGYSDLAKVPVSEAKGHQLHGSYSTLTDKMKIATSPAHLSLNDFDPHSTALHEIQHAVQTREGFANGGSPFDEQWPNMPAFEDVADAQTLAAFVRRGVPPEEAAAAFLNSTGRDATPGARVLLREYADNPDALYSLPSSAKEAYKRLAGEVEARNVQARQYMSPMARKATAPWLTQDVPDNLQIVRMKNVMGIE